jgi:hypothetical protein
MNIILLRNSICCSIRSAKNVYIYYEMFLRHKLIPYIPALMLFVALTSQCIVTAHVSIHTCTARVKHVKLNTKYYVTNHCLSHLHQTRRTRNNSNSFTQILIVILQGR